MGRRSRWVTVSDQVESEEVLKVHPVTLSESLQANDTHVVYMNSIKLQNSSSGVITHDNQFQINFSCYNYQPDVQNIFFTIRDG